MKKVQDPFPVHALFVRSELVSHCPVDGVHNARCKVRRKCIVVTLIQGKYPKRLSSTMC